MYIVYIIRSIPFPEQIYVGKTSDLHQRLAEHNRGTTAHTKKYSPWQLISYIAFQDKGKAIDFEKYLKTGSGREFRARRLL